MSNSIRRKLHLSLPSTASKERSSIPFVSRRKLTDRILRAVWSELAPGRESWLPLSLDLPESGNRPTLLTGRAGAHPRSIWRTRLPFVVAAAFTLSGVLHLVRPTYYTPLVPHFLPGATRLVQLSGGAELICAVGLWRRDRWAGIAAAALLLAVWPANLQGAINAQMAAGLEDQLIGWLRLPLQIPLIWFALQSGSSEKHAQPHADVA